MNKSYTEFKELSSEEAQKRINDLRQETFNLRLQRINGQLENSSRFKVIRKDIARLETLLSQRRNAVAK